MKKEKLKKRWIIILIVILLINLITINNSIVVAEVGQLPKKANIIDVSAGMYYTIAIDKNRNLWAWGYNKWGQLGNNTCADITMPRQVTTNIKFDKIDAGYGHNLAIDVDGILYTWGYNGYGQIGDSTNRRWN